MARIRWVEESEATGEAAKVYREWMASNPGRPRIPEILKCFSPRPELFKALDDLSQTLHFSEGFLDRRTKEMIATYVSALNRCPY